jgi:hypothetical protein
MLWRTASCSAKDQAGETFTWFDHGASNSARLQRAIGAELMVHAGGISMIAWYAILIVILLAADPALAESADAAVIDKLFAFNCFDGSRGAVRIGGNGSVIGTIQFQGSELVPISLPAGTLKFKGEAVCASLKGIPSEPCFEDWALSQTQGRLGTLRRSDFRRQRYPSCYEGWSCPTEYANDDLHHW